MPKITPLRRDQHRSQILSAAAACFSRRGFHQTTVQDICAEAGVSPGAIYLYFPSKDAIIETLAQSAREVTREHLAGAQPKASAADRLDALLRLLEQPGRPARHQLDVRLWAEAIGDARLAQLYQRSRATLVETLTDIGEPAALANRIEPEALAEFLAVLISGFELQWALQPEASTRSAADVLRKLLGVGPAAGGAR